MKITYLKLKNYRCFEEIEFSLHPELTVIVGANGAGKSSLLDALTVALGPYLSKFDEGKGAGFSKLDARRLRSLSNEYEMEPQFPIGIELIGSLETNWAQFNAGLLNSQMGLFEASEIDLYPNEQKLLINSWDKHFDRIQNALHRQSWGKNSFYWRRELTGAKNKTTIADALLLEEYGKYAQSIAREGTGNVLPILGYYGTGRLWLQQKLTESKKALLSESRTIAYRDCLNPSSSYKEFSYWFKQLNQAITQAIDLESQGISSKHVPRLKALRNAVVNAVNICLEQTGWESIYYDSLEKQIQVKNKTEGDFPVTQLSDGIRNVLALAADIAFRCCKLNGHLEDRAVLETPGIVMIDELDLHLHPSWQQTIVPAFQKAFPKIQFILTTHSPHLLSTVPAECIRILKQGQVMYPSIETEGEQSRVVLEDIFGVSTWPPVAIVDDLKRYQTLVSNELYTSLEALQLRQKLDDHYGKNHEELMTADILIRRFEALKAVQKKKLNASD